MASNWHLTRDVDFVRKSQSNVTYLVSSISFYRIISSNLDRKSHHSAIVYNSTAAIRNISVSKPEEVKLTKEFLNTLFEAGANSQFLSLTKRGADFFSRLINFGCSL